MSRNVEMLNGTDRVEPGGFDQVLDASGVSSLVIGDATLLTEAQYSRAGPDLVVNGPDGTRVLIQDYFNLAQPPALQSEGGAVLPADIVAKLAGPANPGEYAQAQSGAAAAPIGTVESAEGAVTATRADGSTVSLEAGASVYQGDVLETGPNGAVGIRFIDDTTFALDEDARMVLDEYVFDPGGSDNTASLSVVKGVFVFVTGQIGKINPADMEVRTPVATIGIRGTKVAGEAAAEGENNEITLLQGAIVIENAGGSVFMSTPLQSAQVSSFFASPSQPRILSQDQASSLYQSVLKFLPPALQRQNERNSDDDQASAGNQDGNSDQANAESENEDSNQAEADDSNNDAVPAGEGDLTEEQLAALALELAELAPAAGGDGENGNGFSITDPFQVVLGTAFQELNGDIGLFSDLIETFNISVDAGDDGETAVAGGRRDDDLFDDGTNPNFITGDSANNELRGGSDPDTLFGGGGDDILIGGGGADFLNGGPGIDTASYADDPGGIVLDLTAGTALDGTGAMDTLAEIENVIGSAFSDQIIGNDVSNVLSGGAGNDTLGAEGGDDVIDGGLGDDVLIAGSGQGDDTIIGGPGTDTVFYPSATDGIVVDLGLGLALGNGSIGTDTLEGVENVSGSFFGDLLIGDANANVLDGIGGNDTLIGGAGNDTLIGGDGVDIVVYDNLFADYSLSLLGNGDVLIQSLSGVGDGNDVLRGVEQVQFQDLIYNLVGNNVPIATDDVAVTTLEQPVTIDVLANDFDLDGDALQIVEIVTAPSDGTITINADGTVTYTPNQGFLGVDTFRYRVGDDQGSDEAGVAVAVFVDASDQPGLILEGSNRNEDLIGSTGNDLISGAGGRDLLLGGAGRDTLSGGRGSDRIDGGSDDDLILISGDVGGTDTIQGGDGFDEIRGGTGNDVLNVAGLDANSGIERLDGGDGFDAIIGSLGEDVFDFRGVEVIGFEVIDGGRQADLVHGSDGADTIRVSDGVDTLFGHAGDDVFLIDGSSSGNDVLFGGDGFDEVRGTSGNDTLLIAGFDAETGIERLDGGAGFDVILGSLGMDTLDFRGVEIVGFEQIDGDRQADLVHGSDGDDTIVVSHGADTLFGHDGDDVFAFIGAGNTEDVLFGGAGFDEIRGSASDDTLILNTFDQSNGIERIDGAAGFDVIAGTLGEDWLDFRGIEVVGIEEIDGGRQADVVHGSAGNDVIRVGHGADTLFGHDGDDVFVFDGDESTADAIFGGDGFDEIRGGAGDDVLDLALLDANSSIERIDGGAGNDLLRGTNGDDVIDLSFVDVVNLEAIDLGRGEDLLIGSAGSDFVLGGDGSDALFGSAGADFLFGGDGGDTLVGGLGADVLTGGGGGDVFAYGAPGDGTVLASNGTAGEAGVSFDLIVDFQSGEDVVQLDAANFDAGASFGVLDTAYNGSNASAIAGFDDGDAILAFDGTYLIYDDNGAGDGYTVLAEVRGDAVSGSDIEIV